VSLRCGLRWCCGSRG